MKVSDFVSQISTGLARSNRYTVMFTPPRLILQNLPLSNDSLKRVSVLCDSVQLPGLNVNTTPIKIFGETREMPYEMNFEPINMTFYVDVPMYTKTLFDQWALGVQTGNTRKFNYYNDYITDMTIAVQDMQDTNRYFVRLYEAYPKTVSAIQMDYANKDIMKLNVTMMFKYWRSAFNENDLNVYPSGIDNLQNSINRNLGVLPEATDVYNGVVYADP